MSNEPKSIVAGFGVSWSRTLPDYPSASHTLKYLFRKLTDGTNQKAFSASPDGPHSYTLTLAPGDTVKLSGEYKLIGYVIDDATAGAATKEIVYESTIEVKPDPLAENGGDHRTHARRTRDLLRATMEGLASGKLSTASVNGKTFSQRQLAEVRSELARYEDLVRAEECAHALRAGQPNPNRILVRFGRTT